MNNVILEKITDFEFEKIREGQDEDCRHLKKLLNNYFEGSSDQKFVLLKSIEELENEFCNINPRDSNKNSIKVEWNKRYSPLKYAVYKGCGYVSEYSK